MGNLEIQSQTQQDGESSNTSQVTSSKLLPLFHHPVENYIEIPLELLERKHPRIAWFFNKYPDYQTKLYEGLR